MPLNSQQLAALVERARHKAPVVSPPLPPASPQRPVRPSLVTPAPQAPSATRPPPSPATLPEAEGRVRIHRWVGRPAPGKGR
jgi:hypothetical protein